MNRTVHRLLSIAVLSSLIAACGGEGVVDNDSEDTGSGVVREDDAPSPTPSPTPTTTLNVASQAQGGIASSDYDAPQANGAIDDQTSTHWTSQAGTPLEIKFEVVERVQKLIIHKNAGTVHTGSNPDLVVELSLNGRDWQTSAITNSSADIPCTHTNSSDTHLECTMDIRQAQYLRITSQNGKAYEITEVEVIAVQ